MGRRPLLIFAIHDSVLPIRYSPFARLWDGALVGGKWLRDGASLLTGYCSLGASCSSLAARQSSLVLRDGWSLVTRHSPLCSLGASCSSLTTCHSSLVSKGWATKK